MNDLINTNTKYIDMSKQEFDPKGFLDHATQDEFFSSNTAFPVIYRNLKKGDEVLKISEGPHQGTEHRRFLRIDIDPGDDRILQADRRIVTSRIHSLFESGTTEAPYSNRQSYYDQHASDVGGRKVVPLSELLERKIGECVEMATVTQLLAQERGDNSYLVSGHLEEGPNRTAHTWNIFERDNAFYIFDPKNNFKSKVSSVVFEDGRYYFKTEKEVNFCYCLD